MLAKTNETRYQELFNSNEEIHLSTPSCILIKHFGKANTTAHLVIFYVKLTIVPRLCCKINTSTSFC